MRYKSYTSSIFTQLDELETSSCIVELDLDEKVENCKTNSINVHIAILCERNWKQKVGCYFTLDEDLYHEYK